MYKLDLHTHSHASPDGGLRAREYEAMLRAGVLDVIAVTDHNTIAFAQELQQALGERIIVGEEITTTQGEIIGLYLSAPVPAGLTPHETVAAIRAQDGLVYIPHPFETVRRGVSLQTLDTLADAVDIIEVLNGRAIFQDRSTQAAAWATEHGTARASSSDAHGWHDWGRSYSMVASLPTRHTLVGLLADAEARLARTKMGPRGLGYPKLNRLRKRMTGHAR